MRERCSKNAFCEMCRFGDFSGKCFGTEEQREMVGKYGGFEKFELIDECYKKDQRIADLEEQLKNAIVPKFEYGQIVWCVFYPNKYREGFIFDEEFVGYTKDKIICRITENEEFDFNEVFATKEEAQAKLEELKGENK